MYFDFDTYDFADTHTAPEADAILDGHSIMTWRTLHESTLDFITRAKQSGVISGQPLVITGHKDSTFVVAILACLKMGVPYVPVDTINPEERINKIIEIVQAPIRYDAHQDVFVRGAQHAKDLEEDDLAYIMFTSGSTGDPKGVQIGKEGLSLFANWSTEHLQLQDVPRVMDHVLFSFDFSLFTLSASLGKGGTCVMCSREMVADKGRFISYLIDSQISVWASTPSFIRQQLLHPNFNHHHIPTLKFFYMGAEPLFPGLVEEIVAKFPGARIINGYGPTEATVSTTWLEVDTSVVKSDRGPYSIGIPKPYATVFLDNGEICIAGDHVMRGYVNRPDLNDGRLFLHNGKRAYRSGDMGYFDEQNILHFRGRIDDQIKMHGYRIELTDVDAALTLLDGVRAGATIAIRRPDGMVLRMVGFVEPNDAMPGDGIQQLPCALEDWRRMLGEHIPDYMMPVELFALSAFPTSNTGKVDRKKLTALYLEPRVRMPQESLQS